MGTAVAAALPAPVEHVVRLPVITPEPAPIPDVSPVVSLRQAETTTKKPIDRAVQMLRDNPEWLSKTDRQLETDTGISKATWSRAKAKV
jgi:hypothetical protein